MTLIPTPAYKSWRLSTRHDAKIFTFEMQDKVITHDKAVLTDVQFLTIWHVN